MLLENSALLAVQELIVGRSRIDVDRSVFDELLKGDSLGGIFFPDPHGGYVKVVRHVDGELVDVFPSGG